MQDSDKCENNRSKKIAIDSTCPPRIIYRKLTLHYKQLVIKIQIANLETAHIHITPTHLVVQKYEVHLDEDEGHPRGRCEGQHNIVTLGVLLQLEILAEFQTRVDHRADAERHSAHSQIEATIVLCRTYRIHVRVSGLGSVAVAAGATRRS